MAAPSVVPNLTNIDFAENAANWTGFSDGAGGAPGPQDEGDIFIQGTQAVSAKISGSNQNKGIWFDNTTGIDMTVTGRHLYIWIAVTTVGILNTIQNGGIYIKVASDAGGNNWNKYFVGGSDITPDARFVRYVIDLTKTPSETAGTPATLTSIRWFGAGMKSTGNAKAENLVVDRMDYGDSLEIAAGDATTPSTWEQIFTSDDDVNNKYGIIDKRSETFFVKGGINIGDASGVRDTTWLDTTSATVVFEDPQYHNGDGLVSSIDAENLYKINFQGNSTGTTSITFGEVIASGDDRRGINGGSINSAGPSYLIDGLTDALEIDTLNFYGMNIQNAADIKASGSASTDFIGCVFRQCGEIQPHDAEFLNNSVIAPKPDLGLEIIQDGATPQIKQIVFVAGSTDDIAADRIWNVDDTPSENAFIDETDDFNSSAANDITIFPATEASGDYLAFGSQQKFNTLRFNTGTAGVGGSVTWQYSNPSSGWSDLQSVVDNTSGFLATGLQDVTYDQPDDWTALSIHDETPLFYIRAKVFSVYSTNPVGTQGFIADTIEHHIHFHASGTFTFDNLQFFGFDPLGGPKWHGENVPTTIINAQNNSNPNSSEFDPGPVTINNSKTFTLTGLQTGSEIRIYDDVGGKPTTERDGTESSSTTFVHTYNFEGADIPIIIVIFHLNFKEIRLFIDLEGVDGATLPIVQETDRVYSNP
jgi:hypothetical protein